MKIKLIAHLMLVLVSFMGSKAIRLVDENTKIVFTGIFIISHVIILRFFVFSHMPPNGHFFIVIQREQTLAFQNKQ